MNLVVMKCNSTSKNNFFWQKIGGFFHYVLLIFFPLKKQKFKFPNTFDMLIISKTGREIVFIKNRLI